MLPVGANPVGDHLPLGVADRWMSQAEPEPKDSRVAYYAECATAAPCHASRVPAAEDLPATLKRSPAPFQRAGVLISHSAERAGQRRPPLSMGELLSDGHDRGHAVADERGAARLRR